MAFEGLSDRLESAFARLKSKGSLTESDVKEAMREVRLALLEADVNYKVAKDFTAKVTERAIGAQVMESLTPAQMVIKIVNEEMIFLMGSDTTEITMQPGKAITVVMMCGLQGAGKTTTTAKIAGKLKLKGKKPLLVACDVYRPAAIKQLQINGEKQEVDVFSMGDNHKPADIAKAAIAHAEKNGHNVVILDTAGRLHIDEDMMAELQNIKAEVDVHQTLLVVDAMTGQDAVNAAQTFNEWLDIDSVMLSKLDGDARGGAALSVRAITGKPIKFAGIGEKLEDIEAFHPDRMASRILGMGDVLTLISGVLYACHIVATSKFTQGRDVFTLTVIQFGTTAVCCWVGTLLENGLPTDGLPAAAWWSLIYLAVAATTLALLFQNIGQKYTNPSSAAVLLALEAPDKVDKSSYVMSFFSYQDSAIGDKKVATVPREPQL